MILGNVILANAYRDVAGQIESSLPPGAVSYTIMNNGTITVRHGAMRIGVMSHTLHVRPDGQWILNVDFQPNSSYAALSVLQSKIKP